MYYGMTIIDSTHVLRVLPLNITDVFVLLGVTGYEVEKIIKNSSILHSILTPPCLIWLSERGCVGTIAVKHSERNKHVRVCNICDEVR